MPKMILYDAKGCLADIRKFLQKEARKKATSIDFIDKESKLTFYLEEVNCDVDILFLYVNVRTGEGIKIAQNCRKIVPWIKLVYFTDTPMYNGFPEGAMPDHIVFLPTDEKKFDQMLINLRNAVRKNQMYCLMISTKKMILRIPYQDILYLRSDGRQVVICTWDEEIKVYGKLCEFIDRLPPYFERCHQSYLINMNYLSKLEMYQANLAGHPNWIPVSQKYYKEVKEKMTIQTSILTKTTQKSDV